jgi:dipeptidyl-peptidase 4
MKGDRHPLGEVDGEWAEAFNTRCGALHRNQIMNRHIIYTAVALALALGACSGRRGGPSTSPHCPKPAAAAEGVDVDPEVARIFGDVPIAGRVPTDLAWSPDGARLAYLRAYDATATKRGLWVAEIGTRQEQPIATGGERSVDEYAWLTSARLAAVMDGDVYALDLAGNAENLTATADPEASLAAAPDGRHVAYVRDNDIYVFDLGARTERPVTRGGTADAYFGGVTWVMGEEFGTETGLGWSPDGRKLWFYAVDESKTAHARISDDAKGTSREQAYPRPGEANPIVRLGVADISRPGEIAPVWMDVGADKDVYIPRVTWFPQSDRLAVIRLDRLQTVLTLLGCDAQKGACTQLLEERDPRWLNLLGEPRFFDGGKRFLWLSERDGYAHIYVVTASGLVERQLTTGRWVVSEIAGVDEKAGVAYFTANAERPVSYGVFRVPLAGGDAERISAKGGVHSALFYDAGTVYADTHSAIALPPRIDVVKPGDVDGDVPPFTLAASDLLPYAREDAANDLFPIEKPDGTEFWCQVTRPAALDPSLRYPVLVYVYGGPGVQAVRDAFHPSMQPWREALAARGFIVFSVDGRGSAGRGRDFETPIHLHLGQIEVEDQLAAVDYLKNQPYVDPARIGVFGWSYGGTMAIALLTKSKGVFRAGAAVAPVVDWREYDSAYTERYLQRPSDNPEGYASSSLLGAAAELRAPLLLAHGLADDNVHFVGTARFIDALVDAGKSFELFVYPGRGHGLKGGRARAHVFSAITKFFERRL